MHAAYRPSEDLAGLAVTSFPSLHVQVALPGLAVTNFPHFACSAGPSRTGSCLSTLHVELALPGPVSLTLWGSVFVLCVLPIVEFYWFAC